jgi:hypothetical protein
MHEKESKKKKKVFFIVLVSEKISLLLMNIVRSLINFFSFLFYFSPIFFFKLIKLLGLILNHFNKSTKNVTRNVSSVMRKPPFLKKNWNNLILWDVN